MPKRKPFIDKKHSTTYRLVYRSQRDPLIADEALGERVLEEVSTKEIEQRTKYGIYYTDDYNYLKHLKNVGEAVELANGEIAEHEIISAPKKRNLPSTLFATKGVELKVGLLNQAASTNELIPDYDPDVAAALEGELDDCDELDDDFILRANAGSDEDEPDMEIDRITDEAKGKAEMMQRFGLIREEKYSDEDSDGENDEDMGSDGFDHEADEQDEKRSRFTNYSMSSSVIKRENGLQMLDDHFETLYEQYDAEKLGHIEDENEMLSGHLGQDDERFQNLLEEYTTAKRKFVPEKPSEDIKEKVLKIAENMGSVDDEELFLTDDEDDYTTNKCKWDCETIHSTFSSSTNHPYVIREEPGNRKHRNFKRALKELEANGEEKMDDTESLASSCSTVRVKGETPEERRMRKAAVKEMRHQRRLEKKSNKNAFKDHKKQFDRQRSTIQVQSRPIS